MTNIGDKFTLWVRKYDGKAYKDQMGIEQKGYVVLEEHVVTVIEIKNDVLDMWTNERRHEGLRATCDVCPKDFFRNWEVFPSDSMTPTFYWQAFEIDGKYYQPVDAVQDIYMRYTPTVRDGKLAIPTGDHIKHCTKHDYYYYVHGARMGDSCVMCRIEEAKMMR